MPGTVRGISMELREVQFVAVCRGLMMALVAGAVMSPTDAMAGIAQLNITINRLSDTQAVLIASGELGLTAEYLSLNLALAGGGDFDPDAFVQGVPPLTIGGVQPDFVFGQDDLPNLVLSTTTLGFPIGSAAGSLTATLSNLNGTETWAAAGTSGTIVTGFFGDGTPVGSFSIVPVPAAVWLFGSALGLLGWMRARSR